MWWTLWSKLFQSLLKTQGLCIAGQSEPEQKASSCPLTALYCHLGIPGPKFHYPVTIASFWSSALTSWWEDLKLFRNVKKQVAGNGWFAMSSFSERRLHKELSRVRNLVISVPLSPNPGSCVLVLPTSALHWAPWGVLASHGLELFISKWLGLA